VYQLENSSFTTLTDTKKYKVMTKNEKDLIKIYQQLNESDQNSVCSFAEYLLSKNKKTVEDNDESGEPVKIERPKEERVVAAIKRLSATYPMINKSGVLDEAANLMTQHMIHGKEANDVIDELETLFLSHYDKYLADK